MLVGCWLGFGVTPFSFGFWLVDVVGLAGGSRYLASRLVFTIDLKGTPDGFFGGNFG
jgi:hypothetical protein